MERDQLIGKLFGFWMVEKFGSKRSNGHHYVCKCKCGLIKEVRKADLLRGGSRSCFPCSMKKVRIPMLGKQFGYWTVISNDTITRRDDLFYTCKCQCDKVQLICGKSLRSGLSTGCKSCIKTKHGYSRDSTGKTPKIYRVWHAMIQRCSNKKHKKYYLYGGRGISVCDRWFKFQNFLEDMGDHPSSDMQLDRIDVDGNYEKSNCRWVSAKENNSNRRISISNREKYDILPLDKACSYCICPRHRK